MLVLCCLDQSRVTYNVSKLSYTKNRHYLVCTALSDGLREFFLKEINTLFHKGCIKLIKVTVKTFIMLQINKCCSFKLSIFICES